MHWKQGGVPNSLVGTVYYKVIKRFKVNHGKKISWFFGNCKNATYKPYFLCLFNRPFLQKRADFGFYNL
jgi:hypothetical protein